MKQSSFEHCISEYGANIYCYCLYLTRNKQEADDLYQDIFLQVMEKDDLDESMNPKSYLLAVATNVWNNKRRKKLWRKQIINEVDIPEEDLSQQVADSFLVEDYVIKQKQLQLLREEVNKLPEKYKPVVLMYYMQEMSTEDISRVLKLPQGTVKSRLFSARKLLKEKMEC